MTKRRSIFLAKNSMLNYVGRDGLFLSSKKQSLYLPRYSTTLESLSLLLCVHKVCHITGVQTDHEELFQCNYYTDHI